tara:strand:- start:116 stop:430 length:315 start_codon:yes stop_codon:yes gene_type:complete
MKFKLFILCTFLFLFSCQSVKDGLTGKKRNNSDEFLIQKKNPLVQPPKYGELPLPENEKIVVKKENVNEIENLLKKNKNILQEDQKNSGLSSVEDLILKKIKDK